MSRIAELRTMRAFIDREIADELGRTVPRGMREQVMDGVADLYGVEVADILAGERGHQVARARHAIAWLLRGHGLTLRDIADVLGYSDHMVVHYACRKIDADPASRALLRGLGAA